MRKFLSFSSWRRAHVFPFFLKELKKYGVTTLVRVCDATYDQAPIEKEGIQVLVSCLYHCLYMRTACPRELGTASCFGKSLRLFQTGQNLCAPLHQPKLVLRNSLCFCEMYLLMSFCSPSALVGIEMSAPGFLDWLGYSGCILVTRLILIQRKIPGLCCVQPRVSHNLLSPLHVALVGFPFTAALLRMTIKLPSLMLRSCCVLSPQCHAGGLLLLGRTQVSVGPSRGSVAGSTALVLPRQADGRKSSAAAPAQRLPPLAATAGCSEHLLLLFYFLVGVCFLFIF